MFEEMPKNFTPIKEVYPEWDEEDQFEFAFAWNGQDGTYGPLLKSMGFEILVQEDEDDYQGDSVVLFSHGEYRGILIFGWGSCSGCDALKGCFSYKDIEELREKLCNDIRWFKTSGDCLNYLENHDWEGEYIFHNGKGFWDTFCAKCRKLLANEIGDGKP